MKNFLLAVSCLLAITTTAQHTSHWKAAPGINGGITIVTQGTWVAGDTIVFTPGTQPRTYFTTQNVHATAAAHITFYASGGEIEMLNGFSFFNCSYIDVDGDHVPGVTYGFKIHHPNDYTGDPIDVQGQSSHMKFHGFWAYHTNDGVRVKNDMQCVDNGDHWPYRMTGFEIYNFKLGSDDTYFPNEGMYLGNTDSYDQSRSLVCNGISIHYRVSGLDSFSVHDGIILNAHRQGINFSGADGNNQNYFYNLYIYNCGNGEANQGTALFIGSASRNVHIYGCNFTKTANIGVHSYCEGLFDFHDNIVDSSGWYTMNGATYFTGGVNNIEIDNFTNFTIPGTFQIQNNTLLANSATKNIRIDNDGNGYVGNNIICNSGTVDNPEHVLYQNICNIIIDTSGHDSTYKVPCDTVKTYHVAVDSSWKDTIPYSTTYSTATLKIRGEIITQKIKSQLVQHDSLLYHDSTGICPKCGWCDTTIRVVGKPKTSYGVMMLTDSVYTTQAKKITHVKSVNLKLMRVNMDNGESYTKVSQTIDSGLDVALTWNYSAIGTNNPFGDSGLVATAWSNLLSANHTKLPKYAFYQNEEGNLAYNQGAAKTYLNGLTAFARIAHQNSITTVGDGGMTNGIMYYMHADYLNRGLVDSANWLQTQTGITGWTTPFGLQQTGFYDTLINGLAATGVDVANLHWYEPVKATNLTSTITTGVLPVVIHFIQRKTGLRVVTNETGTRNTSSSLLTTMLGEWKGTAPPLIIYFDSDGQFAVKIEPTFLAFVLVNP